MEENFQKYKLLLKELRNLIKLTNDSQNKFPKFTKNYNYLEEFKNLKNEKPNSLYEFIYLLSFIFIKIDINKNIWNGNLKEFDKLIIESLKEIFIYNEIILDMEINNFYLSNKIKNQKFSKKNQKLNFLLKIHYIFSHHGNRNNQILITNNYQIIKMFWKFFTHEKRIWNFIIFNNLFEKSNLDVLFKYFKKISIMFK